MEELHMGRDMSHGYAHSHMFCWEGARQIISLWNHSGLLVSLSPCFPAYSPPSEINSRILEYYVKIIFRVWVIKDLSYMRNNILLTCNLLLMLVILCTTSLWDLKEMELDTSFQNVFLYDRRQRSTVLNGSVKKVILLFIYSY